MSIGGGARFRVDGRTPGQMRPVNVQMDVQKWASASLIWKQGDTHVLCSATVDDRVPPFLRGKGVGWVTAEYAMLPTATSERMQRESVKGKLGGRTYEIQRLIGRSLRGVVDTAALGEKTVVIDCDVIQADGGTRTASITGAWVALAMAIEWMQRAGAMPTSPLKTQVGAISAGIFDKQPLLDLDYREDSAAGVDFNVVMLGTGQLVEVQGTAEGEPFSRDQMAELVNYACDGIEQLFQAQKAALDEWRTSR